MWAGGKTKLIPLYLDLLPKNVSDRKYYEPFAGGAAMFNFLSSLSNVNGVLSDINSELISLYHLVRDDPTFLIARMNERQAAWMPLSVPDRKALYYDLRKTYWAMEPGPEATSLLYFLMKTSFNGIWQTCRASQGRYGTPVGLAEQKQAVFNPTTVLNWSANLAHVDLICAPYDQINVAPGSFVFCDPPYRDSFTTYSTDFGDDAQLALIDWCRRVHRDTGSVVWLSNRACGDNFFADNAPDARMHKFDVTYTAGRRKKTAAGYSAKSAREVLLIWQ